MGLLLTRTFFLLAIVHPSSSTLGNLNSIFGMACPFRENLIARPLSKYAYEVGLDKESNYLVQSVMEDPLKLIHDAKAELLIEILKKVMGAVQQGKIAVKNPDKDIENISALMTNMQQYIDAYKGHYARMQDLSAKTSPIDAELNRLHNELERIRSDVAQKESFLNDYTQKLEQTKSSISSELNSITERIVEATGSRIRINLGLLKV